MNFENIGLTIAKVENKNNKTEKFISVENDKSKVKHYFEEYKCLNGEVIHQIPVKQLERDVGYISGKSGSGKSTYVSTYVDQFHKMFPKRPIFLFSFFPEDKNLKQKYIKRIKLDDKFVSTELFIEDFENSLIIFDDIDTIKNLAIKKKLKGINDTILECGRHHNITYLYTSHLTNKSNETRTILNESGSLTIFPKMMMTKAFKYLLGEYFGLSKAQIKMIYNLPSRAITIHKTYPHVVTYEKGAFVLHADLE